MLAALFGKGQKELKVLYILITLTLAAILLYPLGCVLFQSVLTKEGGIGLTNYTSLLSQSSFWTALANSFTVSGISAAIATLMAFFCAYGLHFTRIRPGVKKVIQIIVLLPLFLPSITYGFAVIYSFGRLGLISQLIAPPPFSIYGFWGLLIADVIYTLPPAFLILYNAFFYVDRNFITVSKLMGDGPWQTFYMTAIRPVVGSLLSAFILSFFLSFTDFGIPVSIAGEYEVIATQLYTTMMGAIPNFGEGAVIAMAMLVPSVASVVMLRWVDRFNFRYNKISKAEVSTNVFRDALYLLYYVLISLALLSVFVVMFVVPFVKQWPYQPYFTLDVITRIVSDSSIWQVYEHSIGVALVSAAVGTIFCYAAALVKARSQLPSWCQTTMDSFAMITNTVPGMVLGIGFLFAMSGTPLANTFTILVLANLVHFFTTPYMMATSALSKMNAGWETTGALMGDSWIKTVSRVIVPNSLPTLLQMFQYFFVSAMVTISAVVFLTGARTMLLTTKIKELQYFEKFEEIFVLSLLVFLTNVATKLIFDALTSYVQTHHGQGLLTRLKTFFQSATTRKANQSI
ncbi:ABC transporter permease subunit [Parasutterella secunda]|uniref:ABC transporter permease subunit n=1 Tax=Parasutterella secunda TaxID=626947 RepID=UPI002010F985|nr:ABC transporter permease subunit [Parasutterella secunda]MCL1596250.1 ABC transporter permease subunit [Parasutterella secunda]